MQVPDICMLEQQQHCNLPFDVSAILAGQPGLLTLPCLANRS